ncbi:MAG: dockerin type I repeat-containing protein [Clostridia bacterium]|nr:dockerin type I repeat-containing protein [Clostridia bacterium]
MKNTVKKVICILLCMLMITAAPLSALAVELNSVPVIYVGDTADNALYVKPNKNGATVAFDMNSTKFTGNLTNIFMGVVLADFADVSTGTTSVKTGIKAMLDPILCAPTGESLSADVGPWVYNEPLSQHTEDSILNDNMKGFLSAAAGYVSADEVFFFSYDWRLDPIDSAEALREFIDHVLAVTGKSKTAILSVGTGGVITNAYLYANPEHAASSVSSTVFYGSPLLGNAIIGDLMTGHIVRTRDDYDSFLDSVTDGITGEYRGAAFMDFLSDDSTGSLFGIGAALLGDNSVTSLLVKLSVLLGISIGEAQGLHQTLGVAYNKLASGADDVIYEDFLKEYLRNMPGLWALVPEKDFDDAKDFLFKGEFMEKTLESRVNAYRTVQASTAATFTKAKLNGINVCVVTGYGFQIVPITACVDDVSDGIVSVKYSSAGAVTTDNSKEPDHLLYCTNAKHNHTSPDNDINAAYCILPENTWFLQNVPHADMTKAPVATFLVWLLFGFSQRHVRENTNYTQYMSYSEYSQKLSPYAAPGSEFNEKKLGDLDLSGAVEAADARSALRIAVGLDTATKETKIIADVDGNGTVDATDARLILRYAVGLEHSFPAEDK